MKRPVITFKAMQKMLDERADSAGKEILYLPADALLTPSAVDLARARGIALSQTPSGEGYGQPVAPNPAVQPSADGPGSGEARSGEGQSFSNLRESVLEKLPPELRSSPLVDGLILKAVQQALAAPSVQGEGAHPGAGAMQDGAQKTGDATEWRSDTGGILRVDSHRLPWKDFADSGLKNTINIVDVVGVADKAPMGVGYLEWDAAGFDWKLDYAEVDVVVEGELHITTQGKTLKARPGDVVYIPKGTALRFASPGYVKFVYVTWPADWSGA